MSCDHPVRIHGLCAICGLDISLLSPNSITSNAYISNNDKHHHILHSSLDLTVSTSEAERVELEAQKKLLGQRKLSLVVDLDETIIHATMDSRADKYLKEGTLGVHRITLNDGTGQYYWIKLRPFCLEFLNSLSSLFEMHVYTLGNRSYAQAICSILDPLKELFGDRILSRDDVLPPSLSKDGTSSTQRKSLKRIFPHDDRTVLIIDDRIDVWDGCHNLIPVKPYQYWIGTAFINRGDIIINSDSGPRCPPQPNLKGTLSIPSNEESYKEQLKLIEDILKSCHEEFFLQNDSSNPSTITSLKELPDVKKILLKKRNVVFEGCVFYIETPTDINLKSYNSFYGKFDTPSLLTTFGGRILKNADITLTHILSPIHDRKILLFAKKNLIPIINPDWIIKSSERWHQVDYKPFIIESNVGSDGSDSDSDSDVGSEGDSLNNSNSSNSTNSSEDELLIDLEDDLLSERPSKHRKLQSF